MSRRTWRALFFILLCLTAISGLFGYLYWQKLQQRIAVATTQRLKDDATPEQIIAAVIKLIYIPTDETPSIATVSDLSKLSDQPFFAHAAIGDKVLIFSKAKKAVLFRPSEDKVIEIAPISDTPSPTPTEPAPDASASPSISPSDSPVVSVAPATP